MSNQYSIIRDPLLINYRPVNTFNNNNNRPVNNRPVNNNRPQATFGSSNNNNRPVNNNNGNFRATPADARDKLGNEVYPGCNGTVCLPVAQLCSQRKQKRK